MSDIVAGTPEGIRWTTAVATATTTSFNLASWKDRWVKLLVDQNCYFAFSSHAHDDTNGPGDLTLSGDVTLGQRVTKTGTTEDVGYKVVADDVDAGAVGVQRVVHGKYPYLLLRAKTVATSLVKIKPTSLLVQ